jgi:hypothetical protein
MGFVFKSSDFKKIARVLRATPKQKKNNVRFELEGNSSAQRLSLEIYSNLIIGNRHGNLVTVYTPSSHLQLHFCSGYVLSTMLKEVTFIGEHNGKLSGLIVERGGGC